MTNNEHDDINADDAVSDVDAEPSSIDFRLDVIATDAIINTITADVTITTDDETIRTMLAFRRAVNDPPMPPLVLPPVEPNDD